MLNLVLALLAGVVTVAAPCTLPMLPILLGASVGQTGRMRPAMIALGFAMSFSMVALLLGAITRAFDFDPNHLRNAAAALLLGFGLLMIWPAQYIVDQNGKIVFQHDGEGQYEQIDRTVAGLLNAAS